MINPWIELGDLEDPSSKYAEYAIDSASFLLWSFSGRRYAGLSTTKETYVCPQYDVPIDCTWMSDTSFFDGGRNIVGHILSILGSDQGMVKIPLKHTPVRKVKYVRIGDEDLDAIDYYVEDSRYLVINTPVPACSGLVVNYQYGVEPPSMGKLAAIELANNIIDDLEGRECALPKNVSSVSRQGINFEVYDPQEFLDKGRLGIFIVDSFIAAVNPSGSMKKTKIFAAGLPKGKTKKQSY